MCGKCLRNNPSARTAHPCNINETVREDGLPLFAGGSENNVMGCSEFKIGKASFQIEGLSIPEMQFSGQSNRP